MIYILDDFLGRTLIRMNVMEGPDGIDIKARYKEWVESQLGKLPELVYPITHEAKIETLQARLDWRLKEEQLRLDDFIASLKELKFIDYYSYKHGPLISESGNQIKG